MKMRLPLSLPCLLWALSPATSTSTSDCAKLVSKVMSKSSPEWRLLPPSDPESEFNTFVATEIRMRVDWSGIGKALEGRGCD